MAIAVASDLCAGPTDRRPLIVDLDGTLIRSDLLIETAFSEIGREPLSVFGILRALMKGKAALKHRVANPNKFDASVLPYDKVVLAKIKDASQRGRPVYLASASNESLVEAVAQHLGIFTGWFGSNETINLSGEQKARLLVERFGERGYDYIGNDAADLQVWAHAATVITVRAPAAVARRLASTASDVEHLPVDRSSLSTWTRLLRIHQYAKNVLIFVPLVTTHQFSIDWMARSLFAFVAFSLCASSGYIFNDLADLQADRRHPSKRLRPLASGDVPLVLSIYAALILFALSILISISISPLFFAVMLTYFVLTMAYSFVLKRKMLIDVVTLAMLYTIRVIAGTVAVGTVISEWLLAFSLFIFMSLALIKRYVELTQRMDLGMPDSDNRNYRKADLDVVGALAAASGFNAVTVFAFYINSSVVQTLYRRPQLLWLICPVLLYWISRALMMAHRRHMDDDPITFALRDKNSLITGALILLILLAAI
jgi:4-hydroxybenzoate polyprenyltransferase/phosphoserine phosphatase